MVSEMRFQHLHPDHARRRPAGLSQPVLEGSRSGPRCGGLALPGKSFPGPLGGVWKQGTLLTWESARMLATAPGGQSAGGVSTCVATNAQPGEVGGHGGLCPAAAVRHPRASFLSRMCTDSHRELCVQVAACCGSGGPGPTGSPLRDFSPHPGSNPGSLAVPRLQLHPP